MTEIQIQVFVLTKILLFSLYKKVAQFECLIAQKYLPFLPIHFMLIDQVNTKLDALFFQIRV